MSTKQLIVLWYGGIFMFLLLLVKVSSLVTIAIGAALLLLLLIYTLSRHHKANQRQVLLSIGFPMMLFGIAAFVFGGSADNPTFYWQSPAPDFLPVSQVQVIDPQVVHSLFSDKISGKIQNNSSDTISSVTLRILFGADAKNAEVWHVKVEPLAIAPGASAPFQEQIGDFHLNFQKNWPWSFQVVAVEGE